MTVLQLQPTLDSKNRVPPRPCAPSANIRYVRAVIPVVAIRLTSLLHIKANRIIIVSGLILGICAVLVNLIP